MGSPGSTFMVHAEDQNLASINYLIAGHPKIWYVVPPAYYGAVVAALTAEFAHAPGGKQVTGCPQAPMHKRFLLHPDILRSVHGIPVSRVVQRPGDLMITAPGTFHWGYNSGVNLAEATNLAWDSWWSDGSYRAAAAVGQCTCSIGDRFAFEEAAVKTALREVGPRFGISPDEL